MDNAQPASYDVADYFGTIRKRWWILVFGLAAGIALAWVVTDHQRQVYTAATSVLVETTGSEDTNVVGGRTKGDINLDTEAQLVRSTAVATAAAKLMNVSTPPDRLAGRVTVDVPPNTAVLDIKYSAGTPRDAQSGSHAFAAAYLANRTDGAKAEMDAQIASIASKIKSTRDDLTDVNNRIALVWSGSSERNNLDTQRSNLTSQLNTLTARMNALSTTAIDGGRIIKDAPLPIRPTWPFRKINLASGGLVGLLLGGLVLLVLQRIDRRIRRGVDVVRRCEVTLLAEMPPRVTRPVDLVFPPYAAGGRTFNRLRNEVLASLRRTDQIVVVTGASRGTASTLVAANLACALARTGPEVVLVCAHLPDSLADTAETSRLLGVRAESGLSDVLAGRADLDDALRAAPRQPWLKVLTIGTTAAAPGLLQSQALRDVLTTLRKRADYIVIEAPSTSASADAQSIAGLGDAAILAVELRRSKDTEVADAAEQLRRIGVPLLGAVVLPKLKAARRPVPTPPDDDGFSIGRPATPVRIATSPELTPIAVAPQQATPADGADHPAAPRLEPPNADVASVSASNDRPRPEARSSGRGGAGRASKSRLGRRSRGSSAVARADADRHAT